MLSFGIMVWIIVLGVTAFEVLFTTVLAYHWFRFAPKRIAWMTLVSYVTVAIILVILLAALAANLTL